MKAMVLEEVGKPLMLRHAACPTPRAQEVLIKVHVCGVCRTDLHIVSGELPPPRLPLILGHQVVGRVEAVGANVSRWRTGDRVGVPWLGETCHYCEFCLGGRENICDHAIFTGYLRDGGYAEFCAAHEDFLLPLPSGYSEEALAPMLCAGLIGYRAFRKAFPGQVENKTVGFYGFGSSAHLLIQIAQALGTKVFVFTRPGDATTQAFARSLGASWAGGSDQLPPKSLDAAILFAPVGSLYPQALRAIKKGGVVVSAGIHMSDIPTFPYSLLWEERSLTSVANLTRQDGHDFMQLIEKIPIQAITTSFPLEKANEALDVIRLGTVEGSIILKII